MDNKITIIEGPPPTFESVSEGWVLGLNETPLLSEVALTHLRTFNGASLVERCFKAWSEQSVIYLEFRNSDGLEYLVPILAARTTEVDDGQLLFLWVRLDTEEVEPEFGYGDEFGDDADDDPGFPDP